MTDLDTLLSAPLEPVNDAAFSSGVMQQVMQQQAATRQHRVVLEGAALLVAAAIFLAIVPFASLTHTIEALTLNLGGSFPVAAALAALVLTTIFARAVVDRAE
jgi:hypothetical protein